MENEMERGGRHFHFSDKVTYIERQEVTVQSGGNFYNGPGADDGGAAHKDQDQEEIAMAIADLYDERVEENGQLVPLFADKAQWYAVFRVLSKYCNYPSRITDFVRIMRKNNYDADEPVCSYESIKKANSDCAQLAVDVSLWQQYKNLNGKYLKQCLVAGFLIKKLGFAQ